MRKYLFVILCLVLYLSSSDTALAFSIEPSRIELSLPAGRQRGKMISIDNSKSDEPLHLKMYVEDVIFLPDGTNDFPAAGSTAWSCAKWVKIIPDEIDIPAGRTQNVRVNVSVPQDAKGGYYAMVFFESTPTYVDGLGINFRLGGLLDVSVAKTEIRQAKLASFSFIEPSRIAVDIFNEGNVLIRPKGRIKILNSRKRKIGQLDFNPQRLGILPQTLRKFYLDLKEPLSKGDYYLKAEIDVGTKYLLIGQLPVEVK